MGRSEPLVADAMGLKSDLTQGSTYLKWKHGNDPYGFGTYHGMGTATYYDWAFPIQLRKGSTNGVWLDGHVANISANDSMEMFPSAKTGGPLTLKDMVLDGSTFE